MGFVKKKKKINILLSKGMPDIYLRVAIEKSWRSQNFDFLSSKNTSPGQFFGSSNFTITLNITKYRWDNLAYFLFTPI